MKPLKENMIGFGTTRIVWKKVGSKWVGPSGETRTQKQLDAMAKHTFDRVTIKPKK